MQRISVEKILVIDDDKNILSLLDEFLSVYGYRVIVASNGIEGIHLLNSEDGLGLIITDIRMPGANGNQVAKYLKSKEKTKDIPIIGISGFLDDAEPELFDSIVEKPFKMKELINLINSLI
jgi:CheY-like chemotaxis protein